MKPISEQTTREMMYGKRTILRNISNDTLNVINGALNIKYRPAHVDAVLNMSELVSDAVLAGKDITDITLWWVDFWITTHGNEVLRGRCTMEQYPSPEIEATMALLAGDK